MSAGGLPLRCCNMGQQVVYVMAQVGYAARPHLHETTWRMRMCALSVWPVGQALWHVCHGCAHAPVPPLPRPHVTFVSGHNGSGKSAILQVRNSTAAK